MKNTVAEHYFCLLKEGSELGETLTAKDLTKFAYGVAKGMEFLVSKGVSCTGSDVIVSTWLCRKL